MSMSQRENRVVNVEVQLTADQARDLEATIEILVARRDCNRDEALRMVIGAGLAAIHTSLYDETSSEDDLARLKRRLLEVEQSLAVTRFRLFEAQEAARAWDLSTGAIFTENRALKGLVDRLREEIAELRLTIQELQSAR